MSFVEIIEVAPRDGLQNEPTVLPPEDKLALIARAVSAGARRIEAASFVNPARVPQMADADALTKALPRPARVSYIGLVLNERGFARAIAAGCHEVTVVVVASETFSRRNQGVGTEEMLGRWRSIARAGRIQGIQVTAMIAAAFGCPFEGEISPRSVDRLVATLLEDEPAELGFADTIGCAVPNQVEDLVGRTRARAPVLKLRCHFHDTRNTGMANALAAVRAGVSALDASIGGFGGCPFAPAATGNIATEDLVYMLSRMGLATGFDLDATIETAHWLGARLGKPPVSALSRAGAFPSAGAVDHRFSAGPVSTKSERML